MGNLNLKLTTYAEVSNLRVENHDRSLGELGKLVLMGELAGSTLHEISNILGLFTITVAELEIRMKEGPSCEITREELGHLLSGSSRLASIATTAKTVSRNRPGDPLQCHQLKKLVADALGFIKPYFRKAIEPTVDISEGLEVWCRPGEMLQVLLNIVKNSCEAIQSLDDKWIKISASSSGDGLHLIFTDSGSGFSPEVIPVVGEKTITTKPPGVGTGLGLKTCQGIMRGYGGNLFVDTRCKNTRVVLTFPVRVAKKTIDVQ